MDTFRCDVNIHFNIRNCFSTHADVRGLEHDSRNPIRRRASEYRGESFASCVTLKIALFPMMKTDIPKNISKVLC